MEKRFTLALVLCVIVLVLWQKFMIKPPPPPKEPPAGAPSEVTPPVKPPDAPATGPAGGVPATSPVPPDQVKEVELANDRLRLVLTNLGAAIKSAELVEYHPTAKNKDVPLRFLVPSPDHLNALRLDAWP